MYTSSSSSTIPSTQLSDWIGSAILLPICVYYVFKRSGITILDSLCMLVFDAGRLGFEAISSTLVHLGGPAILLIVPLLLIWYFAAHGYCLGIQVFMFWLGQNLLFLARTTGSINGRPASILNRYEFDLYALLSYIELDGSTMVIGHTLFMLGVAVFLTTLLLPLYVQR